MDEPQRTTPRASRWLSASPPNFQDFTGPPNGDYVRYVEGLLAWSAQEQERQRIEARRTSAPATQNSAAVQPDSQWGRNVRQDARAEPGSVQRTTDGFAPKPPSSAASANASASPGSTAGTSPAWRSKLATVRALPLSVGVFMLGMVAAGIFAPALLPVLIIGWVVLNVIRAVRAASAQRPR